ncbi:hypothetical protein NKH57_24145 [Mesorhizobium sp. M1050]|uniref:hypothetical protein n=1 Tax=Mesorhizobium sp. M1050 TaxID=2957051 RepID=UPI003338E4B3
MRYDYSTRLRDDVTSAVLVAFEKNGIINITAVAERVRVRNLAENVALEDIEHLVLQAAQLVGVAVEFDCVAGLFVDRVADEDSEPASSPLDLPRPTSIQ